MTAGTDVSGALRVAVILASTRPSRRGQEVAEWVVGLSAGRPDVQLELVDLRDHELPMLDEPIPPSMGRYQHEHTRRWAAVVGSFDGFVIVTPEYNHSAPAVLTNAMSFLFAEWNNKAIGFVSYGGHGGVRAVEHLRTICGELMMADVRAQVALSFATDWHERREFSPGEHNESVLRQMIDQVVAWSRALEPLRR